MLRKILIATDLSSRAAKAFERALLLAQPHRASVVLLHVVDEDLPAPMVEAQLREARDHLTHSQAPRAAALGVPLEIRAIAGIAHPAVPEIARSEEADLVLLGAHRRRILRDIFRRDDRGAGDPGRHQPGPYGEPDAPGPVSVGRRRG